MKTYIKDFSAISIACVKEQDGALEQALKNNLVFRNVSEAVTLPKAKKKEMRVLSVEEQNKFMKVILNDRMGPLFMLDLSTGMRRGELLGLRWSDVDLKEGIIKVSQVLQRVKTFEGTGPKTKIVLDTPKSEKGKRSIPLLDEIVLILKEHRKCQAQYLRKLGWDDIKIQEQTTKGLVFINELGGHIEPRNLSRKFYELIDAAGVKKTNLHALRHTFANRGLENGIDLKVMQELLGHAQFSLTADTYTHVMPEQKKEAINKLKGVFKTVN